MRRHIFVTGALDRPLELPIVWDVSHEVYVRRDGRSVMASPCDELLCPPGPTPVDDTARELLEAKLRGFFPDILGARYSRIWSGLRTFAPDEEPVLWPEHFDLGVAVDEVNYGASPGDAGHAAPYAYVGPWAPRQGPFWNVSFGALRPATELPDAEAVASFFADGRAAL